MSLHLIERLSAALIIAAVCIATGTQVATGNQLDGDASPSGAMVGGTPTAIVVTSPSGTIANWSAGHGGPRWSCGYLDMYGTPDGAGDLGIDRKTGPVTPVEGRAYMLSCHDANGDVVYERFTYFDPVNPLGPLAGAERAAQMAVEQLALEPPMIALSPPVGSDQIVGVATWLWVDNAWTTTSASATLAGVTATVSATPTTVVFDTGDGSRITCSTTTAYDTTRPARDQHTECSHTYVRPGTYTLAATITWNVNWSASNSETGSLGSTTRTSDIAVHVVEIQARIH